MRILIAAVGVAALIAGSLVLAGTPADDSSSAPPAQPPAGAGSAGAPAAPASNPPVEPAAGGDNAELLRGFLIEMIEVDATRPASARAGDGAEDMNQRFKRRFDTNRDGRFGDDECLAAVEHLRECLRRRMDADGDGQIDGPECLALQRALHAFGQPFVTESRSLLRRFDADGNGKLTGAEKVAVAHAKELHLAALRQAGGPLLELFDADGDGALGASERQAMVRCLVSGGTPPHLAERTWRDEREEKRTSRQRNLLDRSPAAEQQATAPQPQRP
jgi:Ca2+-binding EF-hand superfamily protein